MPKVEVHTPPDGAALEAPHAARRALFTAFPSSGVHATSQAYPHPPITAPDAAMPTHRGRRTVTSQRAPFRITFRPKEGTSAGLDLTLVPTRSAS